MKSLKVDHTLEVTHSGKIILKLYISFAPGYVIKYGLCLSSDRFQERVPLGVSTPYDRTNVRRY